MKGHNITEIQKLAGLHKTSWVQIKGKTNQVWLKITSKQNHYICILSPKASIQNLKMTLSILQPTMYSNGCVRLPHEVIKVVGLKGSAVLKVPPHI